MNLLHQCFDFIKWLIGLANPENLRRFVDMGGVYWIKYAVLSAIIFAETGLLVGFFLPGDSLLFAAGFLASQQVFSIAALFCLLSVAGIVGDAVNYSLGRQMGVKVLEKGRLRFVKHEHLVQAHEFYERYGAWAIIAARFVPIVRTFVPFIAGVAQMTYRKFAIFNFVGGIGWVGLMLAAGYYLGRVRIIKAHFEATVLVIIFISVLPVVMGVLKPKYRNWVKWSLAGAVVVGLCVAGGALAIGKLQWSQVVEAFGQD